MKLQVVWTTPEVHDHDMAVVQGLTHLIARVPREMGPLPSALTTPRFSLIAQAAEQVGGDSEQLFQAIEHENRFAASIRDKFLAPAQRIATKT
ncbi:hypothetical protein ASG50_24910 [Rhizobium sp. Leaf386]|nr:hypothetical protein ASG50_24910 [Rhizobium sp. Leaf386]